MSDMLSSPPNKVLDDRDPKNSQADLRQQIVKLVAEILARQLLAELQRQTQTSK
jgi:hypothetical protein